MERQFRISIERCLEAEHDGTQFYTSQLLERWRQEDGKFWA
jgi:hypothetical protein